MRLGYEVISNLSLESAIDGAIGMHVLVQFFESILELGDFPACSDSTEATKLIAGGLRCHTKRWRYSDECNARAVAFSMSNDAIMIFRVPGGSGSMSHGLHVSAFWIGRATPELIARFVGIAINNSYSMMDYALYYYIFIHFMD